MIRIKKIKNITEEEEFLLNVNIKILKEIQTNNKLKEFMIDALERVKNIEETEKIELYIYKLNNINFNFKDLSIFLKINRLIVLQDTTQYYLPEKHLSSYETLIKKIEKININ